MTDTDLKRLEEKLDLIINFFGIGGSPRKSVRDIEAELHNRLINLDQKRLTRKKKSDTKGVCP